MTALEKYNKRVAAANSLACVGLDPDFEKIPAEFKSKENPQFEFNKYIIDQTHEFVSTFKPNIAFYESRGDKGLHELKLTMEYLLENHPDIFTICDAKRGDIGNTNNQYAVEVFDWLGCDSITVQPYFGHEAIKPFLDRTDKVTIILVRTSNPGAGEIQDLISGGKPIWQIVAEKTENEWNYNKNCMHMVGGTYPKEIGVTRKIAPETTFLVPGIGAQAGILEATVKAGLNSEKKGMIINSSRGIIFADNPAAEAKKLRDEINQYR